MHLIEWIHGWQPLALCATVLGGLWGCAESAVVAKKPQPVDQGVIATEQPQMQVLAEPVLHPNLSIAAKLLRSGQFIDAEIVLRAILLEQPECARAEFLLGVAVMKQKKYALARPLLESSLARSQGFAERSQVDHFLGWSCYYIGDLDSSKRHFQAHVGSNPTADDSYFALGVIAIDEDRAGDAELALQRAIELIGPHPARSRDRAKALARLGDVAVRREMLDEALGLYEEAAQLWPDHYEVWGKLARVYDAQGRASEAQAARLNQQAAMERAGRVAPVPSTEESGNAQGTP